MLNEVNEVEKGKVVSLEDRIPKLKQQMRRKANRRLIILLLLFFTLISFIIYFQSPLSHINKIDIIGNSAYSKDEIIALTELSEKINIWKVDEKNIKGKIEKLPEVKSAKVQIQLPNTVEISITEYKRIAYIMNGKNYMPVLENGTVLKNSKTAEIPATAPILIGFSEGKELNGMIKELEKLPDMVFNAISEIHHTPKETDTYHVTLFMNDGFEVSATVASFSEKMSHYPAIISQLDPDKKGIIDLEVGSYFKAYELEGAEQVEEEIEGDG